MAEITLNFSGDDPSLRQSIEQAIATYQMLSLGGSAIDFEKWFESWEQGFPVATLNRGLGNYDLTGEQPWRADATKRPRYREWTTPEQRTSLGYRIIEYWKDRSVEGKSVVLAGTDAQLINHIIQISYEGGGQATTSEENEILGGGEVKRRGRPQIFLFFKEDEEDVEPGYRPIEGRISFRLMNKTESQIGAGEINQYATAIQNTFGVTGGRIWKRGKDVATYADWGEGYQLQLLVRSKAEAQSLITDILSIQGHTFKPENFFYSENQNPAVAYPTNPGQVTVAGKVIKAPRKRPIADVRFQWAGLILPSLAKPYYLVDLSGTKDVNQQAQN